MFIGGPKLIFSILWEIRSVLRSVSMSSLMRRCWWLPACDLWLRLVKFRHPMKHQFIFVTFG